MLVLSRKEGESIRIGDDIIITVVRTGNDKVRIGIEAPTTTLVLREELRDRAMNAGPSGIVAESRQVPVPAK